MLDIFSRKVIHREVHYGESGDLAKTFMQHAIIANGGAKPRYIHADNGTSMTSKNVATLLTDLNITRSHSRPHVSNDNPFSEAAFKTLKYCPVFPGTFATLDDAFAARPDRFRGGRPLAPPLPAKVWINKPRTTIETQETRQINPAA
jgi:transposase InsO family protein